MVSSFLAICRHLLSLGMLDAHSYRIRHATVQGRISGGGKEETALLAAAAGAVTIVLLPRWW